jgi:hypothetical protein
VREREREREWGEAKVLRKLLIQLGPVSSTMDF